MTVAEWKGVQRAVNQFFVDQKIPFVPLFIDGKPGDRTKAAIKRAKFLLGYTDAFIRWARGNGSVFLRRLKNPTTLMTRRAIRRGIDRRIAARRVLAISRRGTALIASFEGYYANWYRDPVGVRTIGFGHTSEGLPSWARPPLSHATALRLLDHDLDQYEAGVRRLVKVPLTQGQFDALVSFAYNVGVGGLGGSTLLSLLNRRDYSGAAAQFARWNKGGGRVLPGLTRRRAAEADLFRNG